MRHGHRSGVSHDDSVRGGSSVGGAGPELRIGVTGHINLSPETARLVASELHAHLSGMRAAENGAARAMVGVSCLAPGADSVFAEVLLSLGGRLEVILPSADYGRARLGPADAATFDDLLRRASSVFTLDRERAETAAYVEANDRMLDAIDHLVAVWDGDRKALLPGGTADVVRSALSRDIPVTVIWPEGSRRS